MKENQSLLCYLDFCDMHNSFNLKTLKLFPLITRNSKLHIFAASSGLNSLSRATEQKVTDLSFDPWLF